MLTLKSMLLSRKGSSRQKCTLNESKGLGTESTHTQGCTCTTCKYSLMICVNNK